MRGRGQIPISNLGTGEGGGDPFYVSRPGRRRSSADGSVAGRFGDDVGFEGLVEEVGGFGDVRLFRRKQARRDAAATCREVAAGSDADVEGLGISRVRVRVKVLFETEIILATQRLQQALVNGTLEESLARRGVHVCILDAEIENYNAAGFRMASQLPRLPPPGLGLEDILLIVLALVSVTVFLAFCFLEWYSGYVIELDRIRHLNQRKPIAPLLRHTLGWRLFDPRTTALSLLPLNVSKRIEAAYIYGWLRLGEPLLHVAYDGGDYAVDFSQAQSPASYLNDALSTRITDAGGMRCVAYSAGVAARAADAYL